MNKKVDSKEILEEDVLKDGIDLNKKSKVGEIIDNLEHQINYLMDEAK